ncbi:MAG: hypothetical protein RLZZ196_913 [Bacteroidota bacterium]|jgi:hypothetical protein
MKPQDLIEASPETLPGSFSDDLQFSKHWLCWHLKNIQNQNKKKFSIITALGSWYGNLGIYLSNHNVKFRNLILLDIDKNALDVSKSMLGRLNQYRIFTLIRDANDHKYQLKPNQCVINTSCNDMKNLGWYDRIPNGTLVALQGRNSIQSAVTPTEDLTEFHDLFPMTKTLILDQTKLRDPETSYLRFLKIGFK